jgi:hypothetical protein
MLYCFRRFLCPSSGAKKTVHTAFGTIFELLMMGGETACNM